MQEQDQNTTIPVPEFSVRPQGFKLGDELTLNGRTSRVVGTRPDGSPILDESGVVTTKPTQTTSKNTNIPKRGKWLANRLQSLDADPIYSKGSPEVQKYYREKAYDKWVVPYYKHIGEEPPSKKDFLTRHNSHVDSTMTGTWKAQAASYDKLGNVILERSTKVLSSISSLLDIVTRPFSDMISYGISKPYTPDEAFSAIHREKGLTKILKTSEDYYDKQAEDLEGRIQDKGGHDLSTMATDIATQAVFFEALGGSSASELFKFANPRTGALITKTAKIAWNGAVTGTLWGVSTGAKSDELPTYAAYGVLGDLGLKGASSGFMKVLGKITSRGVQSQILEQTAQDLASGKGVVKPSVDEFVKGGSEVNKQAALASMAKVLNESAQKVNGGESKGAFKRMTPKQQKALLVRISLATSQAQQLDLSKGVSEEIQIEYLKEEEAKRIGVVPVAAKVQQQIDQVIKKAGLDPAKAKLGATLPRHETHIDSPINHITARISFLRNQVKNAEKNDLIMKEVDSLREALKQEQQLLKDVRAKRAELKKTEPTAGAERRMPDVSVELEQLHYHSGREKSVISRKYYLESLREYALKKSNQRAIEAADTAINDYYSGNDKKSIAYSERALTLLHQGESTGVK